MTKQEQKVELGTARVVGLGLFATFVAALVTGGGSPDNIPAFLGGLGNWDASIATTTPWMIHTEPINALSIPTWAIHFSSVLEYLVAMQLVWTYAEATNNPQYKGLTWGMLPLHASGICACTYHFFYNPSSLQFLVTAQAGLTLLGNLTCMLAAYRLAIANGWTTGELNPLPPAKTSARGLVADGVAMQPLEDVENVDSLPQLVAKLTVGTIGLSYLVKYGSLAIDLPFSASVPAALAMVVGIPGLTAAYYYSQSEDLPQLSANNLSMTDVKKYGVSGTVAYVLTELAFWAVAFPVAATVLYQSTGHWPNVVDVEADRAAVAALVFAGANVARLLVPLRLGAALALAPWVDENIVNREKNSVV